MNLWKKISHDKFTIIVLLLCITNIIVRIPFAKIPAFEDEILYFTGVDIISHNNVNPFVYFYGYKPQLMYILPALLFKLIGPSLAWGRIEIYIFSSIALFYVYLLGKQLFSTKVGIAALLLLLTYPLFATQSFLFVDAVPFTAVFLMTLYYYFAKKPWAYTLSASLLVLTQEPGIILLVAILLFDLCTTKRKPRLFLLFPICIFFAWMCVNKVLFGWFLWPYNVSLFNINHILSGLNPRDLHWDFEQSLFKNQEWFIIGIVVIGLVILSVSKRTIYRSKLPVMFFLVLVSIGYYVFPLTGPVQPRYFLEVYPVVFILFSAIFTCFITNRTILLCAVTIICVGFIFSNIVNTFYTPFVYDNEISFGFFRSIYFTQQVIAHIQHEYPDAVLTSQSFVQDQIENPFYGYTTIKSKIFWSDCDCLKATKLRFVLEDQQSAIPISTIPKSILYITTPDQYPCISAQRPELLETLCADKSANPHECIKLYSLPVP